MKYFSRANFLALAGVLFLSACDRSPAEKMAILHSEMQSRINTANFERNTVLREMQQDANEDQQD